MKSTVETPDRSPTFPALYRQKGSETIVLFESRYQGCVMHSTNHLQIGDRVNFVLEDFSAWERLPIGTTVTLIQTT